MQAGWLLGTREDNAEMQRLAEDDRREKNWKRWGPYLAGRQWATVREDYSPEGDCWRYFSHEQAASRAYRWGEDGLLGITDRQCRLCFAIGLWNTRDPILKERLFGLTNLQGNHGEDVKECYYYLDSTPTHSYMRALYQYPQQRFPYEALVEENRRRTRHDPEFELPDTGVFAGQRYFDVTVEYAKAAPDDVLILITVANRGPEPATVHLLPTFWYRNTWTWGCVHEGCWVKPLISVGPDQTLSAEHVTLGRFRLAAGAASSGAGYDWLFTDNATNTARLYGVANQGPYVKDAFHRYLVAGEASAVNPRRFGTKAAAHYRLEIPAGAAIEVPLRMFAEAQSPPAVFGEAFSRLLAARKEECERFYAQIIPAEAGAQQRLVARQAYAGLLWNKQFYHYVVEDWPRGDPNMPPPAESRKTGAMRIGHTCSIETSSRFPTSGSTPGTRPGTWLFTRSPLPAWTRPSPSSNWRFCCANGTCTPTARSRPTSSTWATSIRRCTPGPAGRSTKRRRNRASPIGGSSPARSKSC